MRGTEGTAQVAHLRVSGRHSFCHAICGQLFEPRVNRTSVVNLDPGCPTQQQSRVLQLVLLLADVDIAIGRIQDVEHVIDQIGPVGASMGASPVVVKVRPDNSSCETKTRIGQKRSRVTECFARRRVRIDPHDLTCQNLLPVQGQNCSSNHVGKASGLMAISFCFISGRSSR
jgi:hypothetical protein